MIGHSHYSYHPEFTHHIGTVADQAPTRENPLLVNMPDRVAWHTCGLAMQLSGSGELSRTTDRGAKSGIIFEDVDG